MPNAPIAEASIDPELPIIDPHHHLWFFSAAVLDMLDREKNLTAQALLPAFRGHARYLLDEFLADLNSGHNIRATVYVEVGSMYRRTGPQELRSVGEVEFANGMAAMAASGSSDRHRRLRRDRGQRRPAPRRCGEGSSRGASAGRGRPLSRHSRPACGARCESDGAGSRVQRCSPPTPGQHLSGRLPSPRTARPVL